MLLCQLYRAEFERNFLKMVFKCKTCVIMTFV